MTRSADRPFADRLKLARRLIAAGYPPPPTHLADQYAAAGEDTQRLAERLAALMPIMQPERPWHQRVDATPSDEVRAVLLAGLLGCMGQICPHLRKPGGPQPSIARLALRRIDCGRCVAIIHRPPPGDDETCDVCWQRGVSIFHPFATRTGPTLIVGDACPGCADALGIGPKARTA